MGPSRQGKRVRGGVMVLTPRWAAALVAALVAAAAPMSLFAIGDGDVGRSGGRTHEVGNRRSFVLKAARVYPCDPRQPQIIYRAVIIVRDGIIEAVGADLSPPPDLPLVDLKDATVTPGFVAAASIGGGGHTGGESIAAGYRAVDAFDRYGDFAATLAEGVTTLHLDAGTHRLLTGVGAVVKLAGLPDERVLRADADLCINLGPDVYNPPDHIIIVTPASSDVAIIPAQPQRPASRLGQILALNEAIEAALRLGSSPLRGESEPPTSAPPTLEFSIHPPELAQAWRASLPLRIGAQRAADIKQAVAFLEAHQRKGYVVGGLEADRVADRLAAADVPLVYRVDDPLRSMAGDVGFDPQASLPDGTVLAALDNVMLALASPQGQPTADLRLAAATARRAGLSEQRVLDAITRVPAEILGVADRVGSVSPGKDADLVVLTGDPLAATTHVQRVYVGGRLAFEPPTRGPLVVRAGTVWLGPQQRLRDGAVLIEEGRIQAVGHTVPHPPFARVIDAGPAAFVTPGFIDAHNHLGLEGDRAATGPEMAPSKLIGAADVTDIRVAQSGVTTVALAPYRADARGSQVSAVKTAGADRDERVVRDTAAVAFDMRDTDPAEVKTTLGPRLEAGKKYLEEWTKYEKELAEWKEKQAKGERPVEGPAEEKKVAEPAADDPVTGVWSGKVSGGPLPEPQTGKMSLRLTGTSIEGQVIEPPPPIEHRIVGTLNGDKITGHIEADTQGLGYPQFEATLDKPDHMIGTVTFAGITVSVEGERIEKTPVEFKVVRQKTRGKGGRPLPPKVDETLEPIKALLEKKIPAVVDVRSAAQIDAVLKLLVDEWALQTVLLNAEDARARAAKLAEEGVGVIVPTAMLRTERYQPYLQADDLTRGGVPVAFQSDAEDGARSLPRVVLHAVERGLGADAALTALTLDAARMLRIDGRVGSIERGKDGDLVIFSGDPFDPASRVERVIISGQEVK